MFHLQTCMSESLDFVWQTLTNILLCSSLLTAESFGFTGGPEKIMKAQWHLLKIYDKKRINLNSKIHLKWCSDEQKSAKNILVKFGARDVSVYVAHAPAIKILLLSDVCTELRSVACIFTVVKKS